MEDRQGKYILNFCEKASYKSFCPSSLFEVEKTLELSKEIFQTLCSITENIAIINTKSEDIECSDLFLHSYVYKEALESSVIEGTVCTMA